MTEQPDYAIMVGIWNPSTRCWSGKWYMPRTPEVKCEFSYSPKVESPAPTAICEKCKNRSSEPDNTNRMLGCWSCDKAAHVKCAQTPFVCQKCSEITSRFGNVPPVSRNWLGHFYMYQQQSRGVPVPEEDKFQLKFDFNQKASNILASVTGYGSNRFGEFSVHGILKIEPMASNNSSNSVSYQIEICKNFVVSEAQRAAIAANLPLPTPDHMILENLLPSLRNDGNVNPSSSSITQVSSTSSNNNNLSAPIIASSRRRPTRKADEDDDVMYEDGEDEIPRKRRKAVMSNNKQTKRNVSFVTTLGVESSLQPLLKVWREVNNLAELGLNIVCNSSTSSSVPLSSILRSHVKFGDEELGIALQSQSALVAVSSACTAVDLAIENHRCSLSTASIGRIEKIFPCAVAAAYATDRYGKSVGVLDLSPNQSNLTRSIQGVKGIVHVSSVRDGNDSRSWRDGVTQSIEAMRTAAPDFIVVSASFGQLNKLDWNWAVESLGQLNCPFVLIVEDVLGVSSAQTIRSVCEVMLNKIYIEDGNSPLSTPAYSTGPTSTTIQARPSPSQPYPQTQNYNTQPVMVKKEIHPPPPQQQQHIQQQQHVQQQQQPNKATKPSPQQQQPPNLIPINASTTGNMPKIQRTQGYQQLPIPPESKKQILNSGPVPSPPQQKATLQPNTNMNRNNNPPPPPQQQQHQMSSSHAPIPNMRSNPPIQQQHNIPNHNMSHSNNMQNSQSMMSSQQQQQPPMKQQQNIQQQPMHSNNNNQHSQQRSNNHIGSSSSSMNMDNRSNNMHMDYKDNSDKSTTLRAQTQNNYVNLMDLEPLPFTPEEIEPPPPPRVAVEPQKTKEIKVETFAIPNDDRLDSWTDEVESPRAGNFSYLTASSAFGN